MRHNPSIETLRQLLRYEAETGRLFWLARDRNLSGLEAGGIASPDGYRRVRINGQMCLAHRVIMAMMHGEWPAAQVDHINGNRADNRLCNLRSVQRATNSRNKGRYRNNRSGCTGVHWCKLTSRWVAAIQKDGQRVPLGRFESLDDAIAARRAAEPAFDFHPNHGRISA